VKLICVYCDFYRLKVTVRPPVDNPDVFVFVVWFVFVFTRESSYCFQCILAIAILSVCLSHGWISQKPCKLGSPNLHRQLPGRL